MAAQYPSLELIYELAAAQLERQLGQIDALDSKIATLTGFGGLILAVIFSADALVDRWSPALTIGAVLLCSSLLLFLLGLRGRAYSMDPDVSGLRSRYSNRAAEATRFAVLDSLVLALDANEARIRWKVRLINSGAVLITLSLLLVTLRALYLFER